MRARGYVCQTEVRRYIARHPNGSLKTSIAGFAGPLLRCQYLAQRDPCRSIFWVFAEGLSKVLLCIATLLLFQGRAALLIFVSRPRCSLQLLNGNGWTTHSRQRREQASGLFFGASLSVLGGDLRSVTQVDLVVGMDNEPGNIPHVFGWGGHAQGAR